MASTSTYLNFERNTEAAFNFYKSVFGTEFTAPITRMSASGQPDLSPADANLVMNVALPILGGHVLMATDAPESMGFKLNKGTNVHINLQPDTLEDGQALFDALAVGGQVGMKLERMFWGYFGSLTDQFGVQWMVNCPLETEA